MVRFSKQTMGLLFRVWIIVAICMTICTLMIYMGLQQYNRMSANESIAQIAYEFANSLENNKDNNLALPMIDLQKSLSPFVILFDANNQPLQTNAKLGDTKPLPPVGILEVAKKYGESRVTWEPAKGFRFATVTVYFNKIKTGYVLAGKSLYEAETRMTLIGRLIFTIWIFSIIITFVLVFLLSIYYEKYKEG